MSAYMFFNVSQFIDDEKMEKYRQHVFATVEKFGGRYLILGGDQIILEGEKDLEFPVLIRFDNKEKALAWYRSDEYQNIIQLRLDATIGNLSLIDGFVPE
ncbi:MAG: DUF1330 domain-containing protein [Pyrinomonadaceae bacterium]|nr:DUF1330 domain-containing protein [Pyrinomonadaceae bacterium]